VAETFGEIMSLVCELLWHLVFQLHTFIVSEHLQNRRSLNKLLQKHHLLVVIVETVVGDDVVFRHQDEELLDKWVEVGEAAEVHEPVQIRTQEEQEK
jgi:hypothetical protein